MKTVIIVSHCRSGTHLTIDAMINNFAIFREAPSISQTTLDNLRPQEGGDLQKLIDFQNVVGKQAAICKTHAHHDLDRFFGQSQELRAAMKRLFQNSKIIYVYRDGRDVLVSEYHYHRKFEPALGNISFSEYIRMPNNFDSETYEGEMSRPEYWAHHVRDWLEDEGALKISFEEIKEDYQGTLEKIAKFIDEDLNNKLIDVRRSEKKINWFSKLKQRLIRKFSSKRYSMVSFRKGISGDFCNHFSREDLGFFEEEAGKLNQSLGYK